MKLLHVGVLVVSISVGAAVGSTVRGDAAEPSEAGAALQRPPSPPAPASRPLPTPIAPTAPVRDGGPGAEGS